jgi:retron-type reverse transcriptase
MGRIQCIHTYEDIISIENLLSAWKEFERGKRKKKDVQEFSLRLMDNIIDLHKILANKTYTHGKYEAFNINDPKSRNIHKASVRDRLLHHAVYRILYPFFDRTFIADSYSCRVGKGTHRAIRRFISYGRKVSENNTRTCWVLKCDIRKFFASIDHRVLFSILDKHILDIYILWLLHQIISSFHTQYPTVVQNCGCNLRGIRTRGLPLGNLTSQLLVNIYMNEFDQYMKHRLKAKHYIRYADDFVILSYMKETLEANIIQIEDFLTDTLRLSLHPDKVYIKPFASGVDFLGWVHFPYHRVLRTATKRKMLRKLVGNPSDATRASYRGMLSHGDARKLKDLIKTISYDIS